MKNLPPHVRLERLLEVLSDEIAAATDAELLEVCDDLKMKPQMKGSTALAGVKGLVFPYRRGVLPPPGDPSGLPEIDGPDLRRHQ